MAAYQAYALVPEHVRSHLALILFTCWHVSLPATQPGPSAWWLLVFECARVDAYACHAAGGVVDHQAQASKGCAGTWRAASEADSQPSDPATEDRATDLLRRLLEKRRQLIQSLTTPHVQPLSALEPAGDVARGVLMLPAAGEPTRRSSAAAPFFPFTGLVSDAVTDHVELVNGVGILSSSYQLIAQVGQVDVEARRKMLTARFASRLRCVPWLAQMRIRRYIAQPRGPARGRPWR